MITCSSNPTVHFWEAECPTVFSTAWIFGKQAASKADQHKNQVPKGKAKARGKMTSHCSAEQTIFKLKCSTILNPPWFNEEKAVESESWSRTNLLLMDMKEHLDEPFVNLVCRCRTPRKTLSSRSVMRNHVRRQWNDQHKRLIDDFRKRLVKGCFPNLWKT